MTLPLLSPGDRRGGDPRLRGLARRFHHHVDGGASRRTTTLPVYLYGMLRLGVTPEANAAASLLLAVSIAAVTLASAPCHGLARRGP